MNLLLDTHVFLWWLSDDRRLTAPARAAIEREDAGVYVSAASAWEIAIKAALGKLKPRALDVPREIEAGGFLELPISARHAQAAGGLPRLHADPFDRMLVAQARVEGLTLVTYDPEIAPYDVRRLHV